MLFAAAAMSVGILHAQQVTVSWSLTGSGDDQLKGVSTSENVTFTGVTPGEFITIGNVKKYNEGSGTLFSPASKDEKKTPQEGYDVVFGFEVSSGYSFKPTSLSFFSAADGSGNIHLIDVTISDGSINEKIVDTYQPGRGSSNAEVNTSSISSGNTYEGPINLTFDLYGKPGDVTKGWAIGDIVLIGELISKSDTRESAPLSWNPKEVTLKIRDKFTAPVLVNTENLPVTFSSSDEKLAQVNENGVITLADGELGTAIITATYDGSESGAPYKTTNVTTTINVETNVVNVYAWEEYPEVETIELTNRWTAENTSGTITKESQLLLDDNISISTVFDAKYSNYPLSYLGYDFKGAAQLSRVDAAPTESVMTGIEKADNSPLIVTPNSDLQLVMFFRRQGAELRSVDSDNVAENVITRTHYIGMKADDGKGVVASSHNDIATSIYPELVMGKTLNEAKGDDYLACAAIFNLKAGETYTIWAKGTTIALNAIGYVLPDPEASDKAPISWSSSSVKYKIRDNIEKVELPTLKNEENLEVTYASSNPEIATIDENGKVTLKNEVEGKTTISATYTGNKYVETTVEYVINVVTNEVKAYEWAPFEPEVTFNFDYLWKAGNSDVSAGKLIDDKNIDVSTVYNANANKNYKGTFFGEEFEGSLQIGRVADAPSEGNLTGTENSGSSPLVVKPQTDLQLVVIFRKQGVEIGEPTVVDNKEENVITTTYVIGSTPNDKKSLFAANQSDVTTKLEQTIVDGGAYDGKENANGSNDYLYVAVAWDLKGGETYTIWGTGSTICVNGIGYILPYTAPETPEVKVDEESFVDNTIELNGKNKVVKINASNEGNNVYYRFEAEEAGIEVLAAVPETIVHEGKEYLLVPENGIELSQAGTLLFFEHDPATDIRSEVASITVTGKGDTSGVAGIGNDADSDVEFYNLQGVRVSNPQGGIYIRRQGNTVTKVIVR